jgi:hypothetical protein
MNSSAQMSKRSVLLWGCALAVLVATIGFLLDGWIANQLTAWRSTTVLSVAVGVSRISDWPVLVILLAGSTWAFQRIRRPQLRRIFAAMALRCLTGRTRPSSPAVPGFYGPIHEGRVLIGKHEYNSCPSGPTATAAGAGAALLFVGWRLGA